MKPNIAVSPGYYHQTSTPDNTVTFTITITNRNQGASANYVLSCTTHDVERVVGLAKIR